MIFYLLNLVLLNMLFVNFENVLLVLTDKTSDFVKFECETQINKLQQFLIIWDEVMIRHLNW